MRQVALEDLGDLGLTVRTIDAADEDTDLSLSPGSFLLEKEAAPAVANKYRGSSEQTLVEYLMDKGLLENKVIWVKGLTDKHIERWLNFVQAFNNARDPEKGVFVIEVVNKKSERVLSPSVVWMDLDEQVSQFDTHSFCSIIVSSVGKAKTGQWGEYLAVLATALFGRDVESAEYFLNFINTNNDPYSALDGLWQSEFANSPRGSEPGMDQFVSHPFYLLRTQNKEEIERRIWSEKLKLYFPIISEIQSILVTKYKEKLNDIIFKLKDTDPIIDSAGNEVQSFKDIDINMMDFINKRYGYGESRMIAIDQGTAKTISLLHKLRNDLAHMDICTPQEMEDLFSCSEKYIGTMII
jgi:uncharacterized protein YbaR (Trm112 family)